MPAKKKATTKKTTKKKIVKTKATKKAAVKKTTTKKKTVTKKVAKVAKKTAKKAVKKTVKKIVKKIVTPKAPKIKKIVAPQEFCAILTKRQLNSAPIMTRRSLSRWCCQRNIPICWSMVQMASPLVWRQIYPA